jgi:DNA-binding transcriptional regulator YiaG
MQKEELVMTPEKVRMARLKLGLTQAELAAVMGIRTMSVSDWERGIRTPSSQSVRLIQAYLSGYRPADWPSRRIVVRRR